MAGASTASKVVVADVFLGCGIWEGRHCGHGPESQALLRLESQGGGLMELLPSSPRAPQWPGGQSRLLLLGFLGCRLSQLGAAGITGIASTV